MTMWQGNAHIAAMVKIVEIGLSTKRVPRAKYAESITTNAAALTKTFRGVRVSMVGTVGVADDTIWDMVVV